MNEPKGAYNVPGFVGEQIREIIVSANHKGVVFYTFDGGWITVYIEKQDGEPIVRVSVNDVPVEPKWTALR